CVNLQSNASHCGACDEVCPGTCQSGECTRDPGTWEWGSWQGCSWTAVDELGTTITPADFAQHTFGEPFCVSGTVVADPSYSSFATLGFTLDCSAEGGALVQPTGTGIALSFARAEGPLRIQLQGENNETDPDARWC